MPARLALRGPHRQSGPILLLDQDRSRWNWSLIRRGLDGLNRAMTLTPTPGLNLLQAMIAACHARAVTAADTDWIAISAYHQALALAGSAPPLIALPGTSPPTVTGRRPLSSMVSRNRNVAEY
ncbi:hypothetical protein [Mesorhizobium sp. B2-4-14]|uniref:hypothetical protein n=1 Tax=Mesorhizobium sp. B2-4-14 TaxID=2589935 RepID=UPI001FEED387|nr:hypothetical protein [Mesorhizobium sp. B2-4-14]